MRGQESNRESIKHQCQILATVKYERTSMNSRFGSEKATTPAISLDLNLFFSLRRLGHLRRNARIAVAHGSQTAG